MKNALLTLSLLITPIAFAQDWAPAGNKIKTKWAENINVNQPLNKYPRPIMERSNWKNLNGLWSCAIVDKDAKKPQSFDKKILVPYPVESSLSGVGERVGHNKVVWYETTFQVPKDWNERVLLNFGAVDWQADVWVNDVKVGENKGGFAPFSFDITDALNSKGANTLTVRVWDPTDRGTQPRGKQVSNPSGIWYTPVTGIWQTVWLEPVSSHHIKSLKITPDIDLGKITLDAVTTNHVPNEKVTVSVYDNGTLVAKGTSINDCPVEVSMPENFKLWSPDSPHLYTLQVELSVGGKVVDKMQSYTAMRKYSTKRDKNGIVRLQLNNKNIFHFGPLDQGWWPDGLYTAPTDEALRYDVQKTKDFGYNMIRKHIKVEPARWYTHCDELGIIVWQDMPSGDRSPEWQNRQYFNGTEFARSSESEKIYRKEWADIMNYLYSYPCIGTWVPFNEAWGQFKTEDIATWTKEADPTRLVNPASGGNHYTCGDMLDIHNYPHPDLYFYDAGRATVLGEYGGIGLICPDNLWEPDRNWGYIQFKDSKAATDKYVEYAEQLLNLVKQGFSAAVYTQTTDVEVEVNGLITYDRKVVKMDENRIREINQKICNSLNEL